jgi:hypothetical protein
VFAGEATIYLCLVTTGTDRVAKAVLSESIGEHLFWYLHTIVEGRLRYKAFENRWPVASYHTFICMKKSPGLTSPYIRLSPMS